MGSIYYCANRWETFVGSGHVLRTFPGWRSCFFHLLPERALLSDINEELIETYRAIKRAPREVIAGLRRLTVSSEEFYKMRDYRPRTRLNRAVRLLYLNRTAFGGI